MGWTNPTTRSTGDLITASHWNTDLTDNLDYLKGRAGVVDLESAYRPDTDNSYDFGETDKRWQDIHGMRVHINRRGHVPSSGVRVRHPVDVV